MQLNTQHKQAKKLYYTHLLPASIIASIDLSKLSLVKPSKFSAIFLCIPKNILSNISGCGTFPIPLGVSNRPEKKNDYNTNDFTT